VLQIRNGRAYVALEGMKLWVDLKALSKTTEEAGRRDIPAGRAQPRGEINLIGMDANTALIELERFVEEAHAGGLTSVKIVQRFFRSAYPKEGGAGVTIAFLKGAEEG